MFWHNGIRLYILMIPLYAFDLLTLRRIHPATLLATTVVVTMHAIVSAYWDDPGWISRAMDLWNWVR